MSQPLHPTLFSEEEINVTLECAHDAIANGKLYFIVCQLFGTERDNRTEAVHHWVAERKIAFLKPVCLCEYSILDILRRDDSLVKRRNDLIIFLKKDMYHCLVDALRRQKPHVNNLKNILARSLKSAHFACFDGRWGLAGWIQPQESDERFLLYTHHPAIYAKGRLLCPKTGNTSQNAVRSFLQEVFTQLNKTLELDQLIKLLASVCPSALDHTLSIHEEFVHEELPLHQTQTAPRDDDGMRNAAQKLMTTLSDEQMRIILAYWQMHDYREAAQLYEQKTGLKLSRSNMHDKMKGIKKLFTDIVITYVFDDDESKRLLQYILELSLHRFPEFKEVS